MGYRLRKAVSAKEVSSELGIAYIGEDKEITGVCRSQEKVTGYACFSNTLLDETSGAIIITSLEDQLSYSNSILLSSNPRLDFIRLLTYLNENIGFSHFDYPSEVSSSAVIGKNVVIEDGCVIDANTVIEHNVVIHSGTRIGKNCRIRSCSSIGGDGFGFERTEDGIPLRFPHLGGVKIGDNVEIGALNSISRGALSDTEISDYVKTDNLVHIAHNCKVATGVLITACAELSGGVSLGKNSWIGPNSSFMQKVTVGDNAFIGLGAVVTKDVLPNTVVAGSPAKKLRDL